MLKIVPIKSKTRNKGRLLSIRRKGRSSSKHFWCGQCSSRYFIRRYSRCWYSFWIRREYRILSFVWCNYKWRILGLWWKRLPSSGLNVPPAWVRDLRTDRPRYPWSIIDRDCILNWNLKFKLSKVDGCQLASVGELHFDFAEGACNTFNFQSEERAWLCFDSRTTDFKTCHS